ncbi:MULTISPECIES: hypothetical protein [unclassified Nocardioides]|uniref:hypothetical protein n=1 Tax=unclassified Nocardioides TaxID=2615069 RepID=UPI00005702E4|nr:MULTISPECIES: hypothetical protein [unclassified Nocardioides]ABL79543.1 hypothetical protein Noca_4964 [Nocardioides sp. JS614]
MHDIQITPTPTPTRVSSPRAAGRWMATFLGIPVAGYAGWLVSGHVDSLGAALLGSLITGALLGAVQAWGLGRNRPPIAAWIAATTLGLMVGLGIGAAMVDYETSLGALVVQGAVSGFAVGVAQAVVLRPRLGNVALAWPPALAAIWAAGWATTTAAGIDVDQQFVIFGASGALLVTALTVVLPLALNRNAEAAS